MCKSLGKGQSSRLTGDTGWASGSIEGRIAVEYFDPDPAAQSQKYAFRAHRQTVDGVDCVYPINALAYHPLYVPFLTYTAPPRHFVFLFLIIRGS